LPCPRRIIELYFDSILEHGSDIEQRMDDVYCAVELLKRQNRHYIQGCKEFGNPITMIEDDYEKTIEALLR
jgi:hypothetical protein